VKVTTRNKILCIKTQSRKASEDRKGNTRIHALCDFAASAPFSYGTAAS